MLSRASNSLIDNYDEIINHNTYPHKLAFKGTLALVFAITLSLGGDFFDSSLLATLCSVGSLGVSFGTSYLFNTSKKNREVKRLNDVFSSYLENKKCDMNTTKFGLGTVSFTNLSVYLHRTLRKSSN